MEVYNGIVVGNNHRLVMQAMLAIYSAWKTSCIHIGDETCRSIERSVLCKKHIEISFNDIDDDQFIKIVNQLASSTSNAILIPVDCEAALVVSRLRSRLDVPSIPLMEASKIELFNDKWRFYQFCKKHGFNTPETIYLGKKDHIEFNHIVTQIGLPFVLKPINQSGSVGVHIIYTKEYFDMEVAANPEYMYGPLIAQRFIAGDDGGLSFLSFHGKVHAFAIQKYVKNGIDFVANEFLEQEVHRFCEVSGFHGLCNLDVRIEKNTNKVFFTEANPRLWASTFASVWCGINFVAESIRGPVSGQPIRVLTRGHFHDRRHPIVWPPSWPYLLSGIGARGRVARAMTFDKYILPNFLDSLPSMASSFVKRKMFSKGPLTRPHNQRI